MHRMWTHWIAWTVVTSAAFLTPAKASAVEQNGPTQPSCSVDVLPDGTKLGKCAVRSANGVIVSASVTCNGSLVESVNYDSAGLLDGEFQSGYCNRTGISITAKGTFDHGVLNGHFYGFNCSVVAEGEYRDGLRWGSWHFTPKKDLNCPSGGAAPPPATIPAVNLVDGTGAWSTMFDGHTGEEGILVSGREEGLWIFNYPEGLVSGTFVHGVMEGTWRWYFAAQPTGYVAKQGELKTQYSIHNGVPEGEFVTYYPNTGARVEGAVSGGVPNFGCVTGKWNFLLIHYFEVSGGGGGLPDLASFIVGALIRYSGENGLKFPPAGLGVVVPGGRLVGKWRFYDGAGRLLGDEDLGTGNAHFVFWSSSGDKVCEGELQDGMQNGDWTEYDPGNHPAWLVHWDHGKFGASKPIPLEPPSGSP